MYKSCDKIVNFAEKKKENGDVKIDQIYSEKIIAILWVF